MRASIARLEIACERKKLIRFSEKDDLFLMREVLGKNPYKNRGLWQDIGAAMPSGCDVRRVRERAKKRRKKPASSQKKTGVDEAYTEREELLDDMLELSEEEERTRQKENDRVEREEQSGQQIRKRAMITLSKRKYGNTSDEFEFEGSKEDTPSERPRNQNSTSVITNYLKEKNDTETNIRQQELQLRKAELALQKERFNLEKEERQQQAKMMADLLRALINK
ncbi:vicilin-like seed storage protein At2g18540 [Mizuhopecten yessoensis]|uniref:vicilin-like seed storage protein At2g18540 n=1 Tax=Mizuhopecten yessoensis TaxID=6573 RepID=UPI000B45F58C|nr:vicilin-like seed storage protein At2g18540 [Mizuhopecten yessoensis]